MQLSLNLPVQIPKGAYDYGNRASGEAHGVVLTKPHIVELMLDLAGYDSSLDLAERPLLEPSCGYGAFLIPAVSRLLKSARCHGRDPLSLLHSVAAYDIDGFHVQRTQGALRELLSVNDVEQDDAAQLVETWVREADFLLAPTENRFDFVVGNPPYVRIEQIATILQAEYRRRFQSLYDRADLYVAFIEHGLSLLSESGRLAFICADRWISNRYGAALREIIAGKHRVYCYVDLRRASPFESDVIAYPSIFVVGHGMSADVPVVRLESAAPEECAAVPDALRLPSRSKRKGVSVERYRSWFRGSEPWILSSPAHLNVLREMEESFAALEASATVGIGVATGNDQLYIVDSNADIEAERLVPLAMREDIDRGKIRNAGRCVINTFKDGGGVVDLEEYPRLKHYLLSSEAAIKRRHVARKNPAAWFRTIDRVYPSLVSRPKLLIPDIAGSNEVVFDGGEYHPHHNLYYVVSDSWDLEVLGALLSSKIALFFVWSYAVKMRGGYLRFQAQYLRRIRIPSKDSLGATLVADLRTAFRERRFGDLDELAQQAYGLKRVPSFEFIDTRK